MVRERGTRGDRLAPGNPGEWHMGPTCLAPTRTPLWMGRRLVHGRSELGHRGYDGQHNRELRLVQPALPNLGGKLDDEPERLE